ncbi:porin [Bacteroidia bacterium]|nr:porin [Bacteroidia bacterium]
MLFAPTQAQETLTFNASYVGDAVGNIDGGIKRGGAYLGMANITVDLKTDKWWRGGEFFVNGASIHGTSPSEKLVGDCQVLVNIDGGNHTYMHELWYKQTFGKVELTAGLQDLNANFAVTDNGGEYINSSFGIAGLLSSNIPAPVFPLTALALTAQWNITDHATWLGSVFDGKPTDFDRNPYNLTWNLSKNDGVLLYTELQLKDLLKARSGTYRLGYYYHSKLMEEGETVFKDDYGFYFIADQDLWQSGERRVSAFLQFALSPNVNSLHNFYIGGGVNAYGIFGSRANDVAGIALASLGFHRGMHKHETAIEAFYRLQLTRNISLQPDIQYIINPSGSDKKLSNALAGILRFRVDF